QFSAYDHQFLIGTIPFAIGMAGLALNDLKFLQHPLLSKWGRDYSLGVYLIHPAVAFLVAPFVLRVAPDVATSAAWQISFPVVILCIALIVLDLIHKYLPNGFNILFGAHIPRSE
ncbi:MAG: hypothetical protein PHQ36_08670, partial [Anaerolineales bacterium]|nr:hypothetical protein [Anaerolineales bacterium]